MPIRVIAGSAKGRRLKLVPGDTTRPVMDKVKEACFSILGHGIVGAKFLDLFAGTGSVGIEALSRGADRAVFVELEKLAVQTIIENLETTGFAGNATVRKTDVRAFLKSPPTETFDYIYIAPPQYKGLWLQSLETLDKNPGWTISETRIIVQIDPSEHQPVALKNFAPYDQRRYGKTLLWFFAHHQVLTEKD
jgi:16S rRNA (guanine966-N2)-methyltransferase